MVYLDQGLLSGPNLLIMATRDPFVWENFPPILLDSVKCKMFATISLKKH